MTPRYKIHTPNPTNTNPRWHVIDTHTNKTIADCQAETDAIIIAGLAATTTPKAQPHTHQQHTRRAGLRGLRKIRRGVDVFTRVEVEALREEWMLIASEGLEGKSGAEYYSLRKRNEQRLLEARASAADRLAATVIHQAELLEGAGE